MSEQATASRPGVAIVANCLPPYRAHLHELLAAGIPELALHTLTTHGHADFAWQMQPAESINYVDFSRPGDSPVGRMFRAPLQEWNKGARLIDYVRTHNIQAVIFVSYRYISYLRLFDYCHRHGVPVFVNIDSNIRSERKLNEFERFLKRQMYGWWMKRTTGVMPFGRLGEQFFRKYGAGERRFYYVPCTPDYDAFARVDVERLQRFRQRYGLREGRRIILFSGRLAQVKRVDLLIDAFARIASERPEWDLLIVGDGPLAGDLHKAAERLGQRVKWTGFLEQEELPTAYHASDLLALPSDHEPWALVVQEAMAAGLAVVSSDIVGAAYELVSDGRNGRVFAAGDGDGLTSALLDATAAENIDRYRQAAGEVLTAWRAKADPVTEVRRALADVGVLKAEVQIAGQETTSVR